LHGPDFPPCGVIVAHQLERASKLEPRRRCFRLGIDHTPKQDGRLTEPTGVEQQLPMAKHGLGPHTLVRILSQRAVSAFGELNLAIAFRLAGESEHAGRIEPELRAGHAVRRWLRFWR